jgi:capsule polysaccharide export protein KpsE/RkpR
MNTSLFNSADLLILINKNKIKLVVVGVIAAGAAIIFSSPYFMPPRFKSFAVVYPSNLIAYSSESPTEQMLQIAQSSEIRNKVIKAFDLYTHYKIDTASNTQYQTEAINQFEDNVTIKKTEYESMEITAYDTDPKIASQIVDSIISYFNVKARELQREKCEEVLVICRDQMLRKKAEMDSMEVLLKSYRHEYGILDYDKQSQEVIRGLFWNLASGNTKGATEANKMIESLKEQGGEFNSTSEHLWRIRGTFNDLKVAYENAYRDVHKSLTYTTVVTAPQPADKKSFPIRWLIVAVSVGSSVLLSFILLVIMDARRFSKEVSNG